MDINQLLATRLQNQQLTSSKIKNVKEFVGWFGAVQSQDYAGAKWALAQRLGTSEEEIENAYNNGEILRTHVLRPTWHFIAPEDISWMLKLTASRIKKLMAYYNRILKLDDEVFNLTQEVMKSVLKGGKFLTREQLAKAMEAKGMIFKGQSLGHVMMEAELESVICSGPRIGKQFSYMLVSERAEKTLQLNEKESLKLLTKKYFQSHGPSQIQDFSWWSGLTMAGCKQGVELLGKEIRRENLEGKEYLYIGKLINKDIEAKIFLLPNYDEYGVAYKDRTAISLNKEDKVLDPRQNMPFNNMIVYRGKVLGMWDRKINKDTVVLRAKYFQEENPQIVSEFRKAAEKYGRYLGLKVKFA